MKILVFDNYDSFTYNLVHLIGKVSNYDLEVHRNDKIPLKEIERFDKIILSPGPGLPSEAGILLDVIKKYSGQKSILGVCLGHQAIAEAYGGKLLNLDSVFHGVATKMKVIKKDALFKSIPTKFSAGRYHSWVIDESSLPDELNITVRDENGFIMGVKHKQYDVSGVQFHPESILTEYGEQLIKNWIG